MRRRILTSMWVVLVLGGQISAQSSTNAPPPFDGKPSHRVIAPSNRMVGRPVLTLKDPGLHFMQGPSFTWVRADGQDPFVVTARPQATSASRKGTNEATVEVWDISLPERPKERAFIANMDALKRQMALAMWTPPPRHGDLDLAFLMLSDHGRPQDLELARVKSLHVRFNRLPPNRTLP